MLMQIWSQNRVMVRPTKPGQDAGWANRMTALLRWLIHDRMEESEDEAELLGQLMLERGAAAVITVWDHEEQLALKTVTMQQVEMAAAQAAQLARQGVQSPQVEMAMNWRAWIENPLEQGKAAAVLASLSFSIRRTSSPMETVC